jgi:hypothetical protein
MDILAATWAATRRLALVCRAHPGRALLVTVVMLGWPSAIHWLASPMAQHALAVAA